MIDVMNEEVCSLTTATKWIPQLRGGRVHVSTVYRWTRRGVKGIRLEVVKVGGAVCTSREALVRFFERLTIQDGYESPRMISKRRQREIEYAKKELERLGL